MKQYNNHYYTLLPLLYNYKTWQSIRLSQCSNVILFVIWYARAALW